MTYKGLEYDLDEGKYIMFNNPDNALNYKGNKKVLLDGDLIVWCKVEGVSFKNIVAVSGCVDICNTNVTYIENLKYIGKWADFRYSNIKDLSHIKIEGDICY